MAKGKYHEWLTEEGLLRLEGWARDGLIDEQIAENMGISRTTLYEWKNKYADIANALKNGKDIVDRQVENALFKRATGYSYIEETKERRMVKDSEGNPLRDENGQVIYELVTTKTINKDVQPDTTAQIFWLKNRKPELWRDRKELNHEGNVDTGINVIIAIPDTEDEDT